MRALEEFHNTLKENFSNYVSMIAVGSFAVKDEWIEGRSDKDILLIFDGDFYEHSSRLREFIKNTNLDASHMFVPMTREHFLKNKKHSHDFSNKFRCKTLFGEDIIKDKVLPNKEEAHAIYTSGIEDVKKRIYRTLLNQDIWPEDKIRKVLWKQFKHTFMYLSIKHHHDTGIHPITRDGLVNQIQNETLKKVLQTLNEINFKKKDEITAVASELLGYLNQI